MMKPIHKIIIVILMLPSFALPALAGDTIAVPMKTGKTGTYYVPVNIGEVVTAEMMLDTGSEFLVINEATLMRLWNESRVTYLRDVIGVMANGSDVKVPVYRLSSLGIGCCCVIHDLEVAVFPRNTRQILGLAALRKVAPFSVSLEPANLTLSHCEGSPAAEERLATGIDDRKHGEIPRDMASIVASP